MIFNENGIYISGNGWYFLGRKARERREEQIESLIHPRLEGDEQEQAQEDGRGKPGQRARGSSELLRFPGA